MFTNKVVLVTGGSRGIGAAICKMFANQNAKVYINYSSSEASAKRIKDEIETNHGQAECIHADVMDLESIKSMFKQIENKEGKLDILINNAGIKQDSLMTMMKDGDWNKVIQTNLTGAFHCSKAAIRLMLRRGTGVIINMASVSGIIGNYGQANYSAAKAGLIALTKTMAKELGKFNIRVNAIAPGLIQTDMLGDMKEGAIKEMISSIPLGRIGTIDEVSEAVRFIASDAAAYIHGQCLVIDGGFSS